VIHTSGRPSRVARLETKEILHHKLDGKRSEAKRQSITTQNSAPRELRYTSRGLALTMIGL